MAVCECPARYTDPDGRWVNIAIGAGVGAIGGCVIGWWNAEAGSGGKACLKGGAVGGVAGAVAGATFGASMLATGAVGVGGAALTGTTAVVGTGAATTGSILISGTLAGAAGGAVSGAGNVLASGGGKEAAIAHGWVGALSGAVGGAVGVGAGAGASGYMAARAGSHMVGDAVSGVVGGVLGDAAGQGVMLSFDSEYHFSYGQLLFAGGTGGTFGAAVGFNRDLNRTIGAAVDDGIRSGAAQGVAELDPKFERIHPGDFEVSAIDDNPELHEMWIAAMKKKAASRKGNAFARYLDNVEHGRVSTRAELAKAYEVVRDEFADAAKAKGYTWDEIHHWNYDKNDYSMYVVDPRNLFPAATRVQHELIHRMTNIGGSNKSYFNANVSPLHELDLGAPQTPLPAFKSSGTTAGGSDGGKGP